MSYITFFHLLLQFPCFYLQTEQNWAGKKDKPEKQSTRDFRNALGLFWCELGISMTSPIADLLLSRLHTHTYTHTHSNPNLFTPSPIPRTSPNWQISVFWSTWISIDMHLMSILRYESSLTPSFSSRKKERGWSVTQIGWITFFSEPHCSHASQARSFCFFAQYPCSVYTVWSTVQQYMDKMDSSYKKDPYAPRASFAIPDAQNQTITAIICLWVDMQEIANGINVLSAQSFYATIWSLTSFAIAVTLLRLYTRAFIVKALGLDDALIFFGLVWMASYLCSTSTFADHSWSSFNRSVLS